MKLPAVLLGFAIAAHAANVQSQDKAEFRARIDDTLHCSGCHGMDGLGKPTAGIPMFAGQIGHFCRLPEGRTFLMQVPGLLSARLTDDRAAAVTTWIVRTCAGASLPTDFTPYTAEEAKRHRKNRPADVIGKRNALYRELLIDGYAIQ